MAPSQYTVSMEIVQGVLSMEGDQMRRVLQSRLIMVVSRWSYSKWNLELMEKNMNRLANHQSCTHMLYLHCFRNQRSNSRSPRHGPYMFGSSSDK